MNRIVETTPKHGLAALLGKNVTLWCTRYIYTGKLIGISSDSCLLEDPSLVYETGKFSEPNWADAQKLPKKQWYVMLHSIESFGIMK
jgi:hydroxyacyl-ACP dehydratase HTD2-like protein with hotdog domain